VAERSAAEELEAWSYWAPAESRKCHVQADARAWITAAFSAEPVTYWLPSASFLPNCVNWPSSVAPTLHLPPLVYPTPALAIQTDISPRLEYMIRLLAAPFEKLRCPFTD
jgi:hypothetical protein